MPSATPKIAVVYWSLCKDGHVKELAEAEAKGAKAAGAQVDVLQFKETLPDEVLTKMHAQPKADYPVVTPDDLEKYDGFIFGIPTRYGRTPAQVSAFFDQTGKQWATGGFNGKFAAIFTSTASQHGGQETTALTTVPYFAHQGIIYVPMGYGQPALTDISEVIGGSAYGAAAIANGDGSRQVTAKERELAEFQGKDFATKVGYFVAGKAAAK